jgi:O-succinylbenzoic acid--CoA ligase
VGPVSHLRPVSGSAAEIHALLTEWNQAETAEPLYVETSGSTGVPKKVALSREAMRAAVAATHERLGGPGQWVLNLPPTNVAGLMVLFRSVVSGIPPADRIGAAGGRAYLSLVPTQLHRMLDDTAAVQALRGFAAVLIGGAAFAPELRERAEALRIPVVSTYGMSETCGGCVYDSAPLTGVDLRIESGEVLVRGPMLFDGYVDDPERTAEVLRDGWFHSGDMGEIVGGKLRITGRRDDMINTGGVKVSGPVVADTLLELEAIREAVVLGVPDAEWGERVVAFVVGAAELAEMRDHVSATHPRTWAPRQLVVLEALPLLPNGKVDRVALRELA